MKQMLDQQIKSISNIYEKIDFSDETIYSQWLAQTYFFVRHSTRLLNLSAALTPFELQFFHLRANEHAVEEKGHERMIESDLKNLGLEINHFSENSSTQTFYQCQYYGIEHIHPLCFLGYVLVLESLPITLGVELLPIIEKKFGKNACSFVRVHSQEDVKHIKSLIAVFEKLNPEIITAIKDNLEQASYLYIQFLNEIIEKSAVKKMAA